MKKAKQEPKQKKSELGSEGMEEVKGFRKNFVIVSVFYVIAGVILLFWPNMSVELLSKALSIGLLVLGLAHIVIYFTGDHIQNIMNMDLTIGVVCSAFASFLLLHPDFIITATPFGIGILLLMGSIMKRQNSIDIKRMGFKHWKVLLFFAILLFLLGAVLIYNPFEGQILVIYIGASLILEGALNIISILVISRHMKKMTQRKIAEAPSGAHHGEYAEIVDGSAFDSDENNELETR